MARDTLSVTDNRTGATYEVPITDGTVRAIDFRQITAGDDEEVLDLAADRVAATQGPKQRQFIARLAPGEPGGAAAADVVEDGELAVAVAIAEAVEAHGARQERVVAVGAVEHEEAAGGGAAGDRRAGEPH